MIRSSNFSSIQFWSLPLGPEVLSRKEMIEQVIFNKLYGPYMTFQPIEVLIQLSNTAIERQKIFLNNFRS